MRKALLVGIDHYSHSPLKGCVNDAVEMGKVLSYYEEGGSPNFLTNVIKSEVGGPTITRARIRKEIHSLFMGDYEIALLYFSGHGLLNPSGSGYIITQDGIKNDVGIPMDEILQIANQSKCRNRILILDCCNSGVLGMPALFSRNASLISEGVTILGASRDDEIAMEVNSHGLFTSHLLSGLKGEASNILGEITPALLYAYVDKLFSPFGQRPVFKSSVPRFVALTKTSPSISTTLLREITTYFRTQDYKLHLDVSYDLRSPSGNRQSQLDFNKILKMASVGLIKSVNHEVLYNPAIDEERDEEICELTRKGKYYWKLVANKKI